MIAESMNAWSNVVTASLRPCQPAVSSYLAPMPSPSTSSSDTFANFQAELHEILDYKWVESEKAGHDIGFEKALKQWMERFRPEWRKKRREAKAKG